MIDHNDASPTSGALGVALLSGVLFGAGLALAAHNLGAGWLASFGAYSLGGMAGFILSALASDTQGEF